MRECEIDFWRWWWSGASLPFGFLKKNLIIVLAVDAETSLAAPHPSVDS